MEKQLDGCYTRLLRAALNVSWKDHISDKELYGDLPSLSNRYAGVPERDRPYSYSTFFSFTVVLQFYLNNFNSRLTALLKNQ